MSNEKLMQSYRELQAKFNEGAHPDDLIKTRFLPKDYSVKRALKLFDGTKESINTLRFAVRCARDKHQVAEEFEKYKIDPELVPRVYTNTLKLRGEFDYDTILSSYLESQGGMKDRFAIYNFIKESEDPEKTLGSFIKDGVCESHIMYYITPPEIKKEVKKDGTKALIRLYKNGYKHLDVVIYDHFRTLQGGLIKEFKTLVDAGIPKNLIDQREIAKLLEGRMSLRDLRILYNFGSIYFTEIFLYIVENHFGYGERDVISLLNTLVSLGIDKTTLLTGQIS